MATSQRSRSRRTSSSKNRAPRYVEPVLDPTWQNPYTPSAAERDANLGATRAFVLRRRRPQLVVTALVAVALIIGVVLSPWLLVVGLLVAAFGAFDLQRALAAAPSKGDGLGAVMLETFTPGGSPTDRQRLVTVLDRLSATFGVTGVSAFIIEDSTYNATLVPNGPSFSLFITNAVMRDFELIELEGVVAHLLARHRLGALARAAASASMDLSPALRRELAGEGVAYRADEVAAAAIRYPLGLAGALRKCARQVVEPSSFFATSTYDRWRYTFFNAWSDRPEGDLSDLDDVELRALALEEW